jgi:hypothetical protein
MANQSIGGHWVMIHFCAFYRTLRDWTCMWKIFVRKIDCFKRKDWICEGTRADERESLSIVFFL